jgi:hypothetical protein
MHNARYHVALRAVGDYILSFLPNFQSILLYQLSMCRLRLGCLHIRLVLGYCTAVPFLCAFEPAVNNLLLMIDLITPALPAQSTHVETHLPVHGLLALLQHSDVNLVVHKCHTVPSS